MENKVLAKVNGKEITQNDVNIFIERLGPQHAAQFQGEAGQKQILDELVNQSLFCADAVENKINETDAYKDEMAKMSDMVLTQINVSNLVNSIQVTDEEAANYFEMAKANFAQPATADTSHILVADEETCKDLRNKIINEEISFEDAAKEHSSCPSKDNGGRLGSYPKGQMVPEYDAVSFEMSEGEISEPVQTQFGYHLIRLNSKTEGGEAVYEEVKDRVQKELLTQKQREAYVAKIADMKAKHSVEYL